MQQEQQSNYGHDRIAIVGNSGIDGPPLASLLSCGFSHPGSSMSINPSPSVVNTIAALRLWPGYCFFDGEQRPIQYLRQRYPT